MAVAYYDRVKFLVSGTPGTGAITPGSALTSFRTPASASIPDTTALVLLIEDGTAWEVCDSVSSSTGTSLSRGTLRGSSTGSRLSLTSAAIVSVIVASGDLNKLLSSDATALLTKGFTVTPNNLGNITSFTVDPALGNCQYGTNHGAATWTAPASDCVVDILVTNDGSAGSITFSGFTVSSNTGDALTTTNTSKFLVQIRRINSVATYKIVALQ